jgi:hypothetical protein
MPRVFVTTDSSEIPDGAQVLLDEEVYSVHLSTGQAASQLVQRIAWAISDAEHAEGARADRRSPAAPRSLRHPVDMRPTARVAIGA